MTDEPLGERLLNAAPDLAGARQALDRLPELRVLLSAVTIMDTSLPWAC